MDHSEQNGPRATTLTSNTSPDSSFHGMTGRGHQPLKRSEGSAAARARIFEATSSESWGCGSHPDKFPSSRSSFEVLIGFKDLLTGLRLNLTLHLRGGLDDVRLTVSQIISIFLNIISPTSNPQNHDNNLQISIPPAAEPLDNTALSFSQTT